MFYVHQTYNTFPHKTFSYRFKYKSSGGECGVFAEVIAIEINDVKYLLTSIRRLRTNMIYRLYQIQKMRR